MVNTKLANEYMKAFKKLGADLRIKEPIRLDHISKQPDVIMLEETDSISSAIES